MENEKTQASAIHVFGLANIGCTMENVTFQTMIQGLETQHEVPATTGVSEAVPTRDEELFHFIHPTVGYDQERAVHEEVKRLVSRQGIQEICSYLKLMANEKKILLPQSPSTAYVELQRMGMPRGEGFSEKTFMRYYKR